LDRGDAPAPRRSPARPAAAGGQLAAPAPPRARALPADRIEARLSSSRRPPAAAELGLPEKIVAIHQQLTHAGAPHAFGGALALAYYAEPRATIDIDLNVFVAPSDYPDIAQALAVLGIAGGADEKGVVERDGQCRLWWGQTPVDVFFAYDALHAAMRGALRREPFAGTTIPVLAPEHLAICKALFNRPKDWLDIEQIIVSVEDLDVAEIRTWLERIIGREDPRRLRVEGLLAR
jgi:hypothetical protein